MNERRHLCEVLQGLEAPPAFVAWSRRYGCAWTQAIYACPLSEWLLALAGRLQLHGLVPGSALTAWGCACWQLLVDLEVPEADEPHAWFLVEEARCVARGEHLSQRRGDATELAARAVALGPRTATPVAVLVWSCAGLLVSCGTRRTLPFVVEAIVVDVGVESERSDEEAMEARVLSVTKRELGALILDALERCESARRAAGTEEVPSV